MSSSHVDQNLLFGFLALQNDFIAREELIAAVSVWLTDKSRSLDEILRERRALADDEHQLVAALVRKHLERHDNDAEKSLAALSSVRGLREDLKKLGDADVEATLVHVSSTRRDEDERSAKTLSPDESAPSGSRFRILRPHAEGGLGQVFVAQDQELNREVALKEIKLHRADDPDSRSRFVLEAEITGGLEHPGIVPVYGLGQYADGRPFYAMRFIRGDSLGEAVDRFHAQPSLHNAYDSVEFRKLLGRFIDVCNAIEYAHSRGVLHRDLKPGNIMLGKYGETLVVDWGLAKAQGRDDQHQQSDEHTLQPRSGSGSVETLMGSAVGTPAFMSPEQAAGRLDQLGPPADVYSLGATLYYVLTGQPPFGKENIGTVLRRVQAGEFPAPQAIKPHIPMALEAICLKAMRRDPQDRYPSPQALADDVERYLADEAVAARAEPIAIRVRRWLRKHPRSVAAVAATLLVGISSAVAISAIVGERNQQLAQANTSLTDANTKLTKANAAERAATQAEQQAKLNAENVTKYLVNIFRSPDPSLGGRMITVAELLDRSVQDLQEGRATNPQTKAVLLEAIGTSYLGLALYHESIPLFEEARSIRIAQLGEDHPDTLTTANSLAKAYELTSQFGKAFPLYEQTFQRRRATLGEDDPATLTSANDIAGAYLRAGYFWKARSLYEQTLERSRTKLGEDHPITINAAGSLATAYLPLGQRDKALRLFEQTLQLWRTKLGEDHPVTLTTQEHLAQAYQADGQLDKALPLFEQTLRHQRAKLGPEHPSTLATMALLATAYRDNKDLAKAEATFAECLGLMQRNRPDWWATFDTQTQLGVVLARQRRFAEAEPLLIAGYEGLAARVATIPQSKRNSATQALRQLFALYVVWDKPEQSEKWKKVLEKYGPERPVPADEQESQQEIAKTLVNQIAAGKFEMAIEPFTEAMKKALPADKLKQVWDGIISQRGPLKRATEIRNEVIKRLNTVFVTCEFQRSKLETKVSFTDDGEITALFFVPLHEYRPPSYANRSTFEEAEITIGKGFWALPGTLSLPVGDGLFPAVVLVHGAGSLDRDETAGPNKHFRDLAYGLASQGIAVLRCEKRTKHHQLAISVVPRSIATVKEEFVDDALAAVDALAAHDRIDNTRIFVLGHDLGGVLLPRIGTASEKVAGVIIFAGTTRPWEDFVLDQWKYILAFDGKVTEGEQKAIQELEKSVAKVKSPDLSPETAAKDLPLGIPATYWLDLRGYHPAEAAKEMKQPILILQGERDYLVSMEDFAQWKKTLASRKNVTFKSYSNLNHLFIAGEGKSSPADHLVPGNVAEPVIMDIAMWIKSQSL